jgi:hypothetical protein
LPRLFGIFTFTRPLVMRVKPQRLTPAGVASVFLAAAFLTMALVPVAGGVTLVVVVLGLRWG